MMPQKSNYYRMQFFYDSLILYVKIEKHAKEYFTKHIDNWILKNKVPSFCSYKCFFLIHKKIIDIRNFRVMSIPRLFLKL